VLDIRSEMIQLTAGIRKLGGIRRALKIRKMSPAFSGGWVGCQTY